MSHSHTMAQLCSSCNMEIAERSAFTTKACGVHVYHECCVRQLETLYGCTECIRCAPTVMSMVRMGNVPMDSGADSFTSTLCQSLISAQALPTHGQHHTSAQTVVPPSDSARQAPRPTDVVQMLAMGARPLVRAPQPDSMSTTERAQVHALLQEHASVEAMLDRGVSFASVLRAGVTCKAWFELGYTFRSAIDMGANWDALQRMGAGRNLSDRYDWESLQDPPISLRFDQLLSSVFDSSWETLAARRATPNMLRRLGFSVTTAVNLGIQLHQWIPFNYITLSEFHEYLGLSKSLLIDVIRPTARWVTDMHWTEDDLFRVLGIAPKGSRTQAVRPAASRAPVRGQPGRR